MAGLKKCAWLLWALSLTVGPVAAQVPQESDFAADEIDQGEALALLNSLASNNTEVPAVARRDGTGCSPSKLKIRREWRTLSKAQRRSYIAAVKCIQTKPSVLDPAVAPGSKSLYDDFVVIHLMQTMNIHLSGIFLTWHRYYTWAWEEKLRTECGYQGTVPYWEWGFDVRNPAASPVFDGSDTSLGGNGEFIPHEGMILTEGLNPDALIPLPPGSGGGCVKTGPFANMTVNIGAVALAQYGTSQVASSANPLGPDNARCLRRDLNAGIASRFNTFRNTTTLILQNQDVEHFQAIMQADPRYVHGELGVHGGGHFTIGGDPGADPFISPGDPAFWVHHSQIDRLYWIWQMLDFPNRQTVFGTGTFMNYIPSPNTTVEDVLDISPLAPPIKIKDVMSTVGGPFCYIYI